MLSRKLQKFPYKNYKNFIELRHKLQGFGNPEVARLGGSDIGVLMGFDQYRSKLELFHQMIRETPPVHFDNIFTWKGKVLEKISVEEWWRYIDPLNQSQEVFEENINKGNKLRSYRPANFTYINPEYPQFAINMDFMCRRYKFVPEGCVEVKNTSSQATDKWESGVSPSHIYQLITQVHTSGHQYGEIFQLKDSTYPEIIPFYKEDTNTIFQSVVQAADDFLNNVIFVKKELAKGLQDEEKEALIAEYEPMAESGEATEKFLKEKHQNLPENLPMEGDMETFGLAKQYLEFGQTKKEATAEQSGIKNRLIQIMGNNRVKCIDFGAAGKVSNYSKFTVSPKILKG